MKIYNPVASGKASGRAFGGVFSFNRGMATFKRYVKPSNPNTPEQQEVKNRFSYLTKYWANSLTYEQITAWNEWVLPWTDTYGNTVLLTGINKFCIINDTLSIAGKALRLTPPNLTPSELILTDSSSENEFLVFITQPSDAEAAAQRPFIFAEAVGFVQASVHDPNYISFSMNGMPISRRPLDKNYKYGDFLQEEGPTLYPEGEYINGSAPTPGQKLFSIRLTRINEQGFWSNTVVLTRTYTNP